jgi:hypothetical protein
VLLLTRAQHLEAHVDRFVGLQGPVGRVHDPTNAKLRGCTQLRTRNSLAPNHSVRYALREVYIFIRIHNCTRIPTEILFECMLPYCLAK